MARRSRPTSEPRVPPADSADAAQLRYVAEAEPGLRRLRAGIGFRYADPRGRQVRDAATLRRLRTLAIPPAWRDVWICSDPCGHLQATGRDARGRKQHRYHPRWRAVRDAGKFDRLATFGRALPALRRRVSRALALPGLPREKVLAAIVRLLEQTCARVGNEEYARSNRSYGLTTLRDQHADVRRGQLLLEFRGKSGRVHRCEVRDRRVARIVARCQDLPGAELFQYVDERGRRHGLDSADVNDFLREMTGEDFTAKDFRTWAGSLAFAKAAQAAPPAPTTAARHRQLLAALDEVAARLRNTRAVSRSSYVHPSLIEAVQRGTLLPLSAPPAGPRGLSADERALLVLLEQLRPLPSIRPAPSRRAAA